MPLDAKSHDAQHDNEMTLIASARSANIGLARQTVACFAAAASFTVDEIDDIKMAISEAVTNSIVHAYAEQPEGQITVRARLDASGLWVSVSDTGCGIEDVGWALEATNTTAPDEHMGLGLAFINSLMDEVQIDSTPGSGTSVSMFKRLVAARQPRLH